MTTFIFGALLLLVCYLLFLLAGLIRIMSKKPPKPPGASHE